jgi:N-acetylglucosaminyldiphosphoundecaprenol N-acetyl-beta-D-mannosaminyltransferase
VGPTTDKQAELVRIAGLSFCRFTEAEAVQHVISQSQAGQGGWILPANVDVCRQASRDPSARTLVERATLIVPDGMPLIWGSRLRGQRLTERVTGSSLLFTLSQEAADAGRSVYFLGGAAGVPEAAARNLIKRYPGLKVAGTDSPPLGFDATAAGISEVRERLLAAAPDIVYVGLGFPKQERLIAELAPALPTAWFLSCGAAIPFAAGSLARAPGWMQRGGLEWAYRLIIEPRRLFKRYLLDDLPYAVGLLLSSAISRVTGELFDFPPRAGASTWSTASLGMHGGAGWHVSWHRLGGMQLCCSNSWSNSCSNSVLGPG